MDPAPVDRAQSHGRARVGEDDLRGLRDKYTRMRAMRAAHHAGEEDASAVRPQMAELASHFPGALREIDDLELAEIDRRLAQLDAVLRGNGHLEPWMEAIALFHRLTRGALAVKRWLNGRRVVTEEVARSFLAEHTSLRFAEDAAAWRTQLDSLAVPPSGRISDLVYERIAAVLQVSDGEARGLAFGRQRASRIRALRTRGR